MTGYLLLAGAIAAEVTGTVALRFSDGFSKLGPSVIVVLGYGLAFWLLARALRTGLPLGLAYGIWAAAGVALVATIGAVFLNERLTGVGIGGLVLVAAGVLLLELGQAK